LILAGKTMFSLRPAPGDLLLVRCVISEKVWQGAWLCIIIAAVKTIKTITLS